ncbi:MAG TPA: TraR/DksA C4-type zinc finger protein [Gammaproteobacteria bacterium]
MNHLSTEQLNTMKSRLGEERSRLRALIREELLRNDAEQYGDLAGQVHDTGDESVADLLADVNISMVGRLIQELREVESALERINMGSYGICEDCATTIPFSRLEAYPTARRCLADQERHEKLFTEENKPSL